MDKGYIRLKTAAEILGVDSSTLVTSNKHKPFHIKSKEGKNESYFDLNGFLRREALEEELKAKSSLFVEYMRHIENITYTQIAKVAKTSIQAIASHNYSLKKAIEMVSWYRDNKPEYIDRFDKYYGWK